MEQDDHAWGENGILSGAFGVNGDPKEAEGDDCDNDDEREEDDDSDDEKFASDENRYPIETEKEAERSLERARKNEPVESFEKIAESIVEEHPELVHEKLAGLGYSIGQQIGRGLLDSLESNDS